MLLQNSIQCPHQAVKRFNLALAQRVDNAHCCPFFVATPNRGGFLVVFNGDVGVGVALTDAGCVVHALVRDDTNRVFSLLYGGENHGVFLFVGTNLSAKV